MKIAMLAGGIGITPFRSMIQYSIDMNLGIDIVLMCSNRTEDDIIFKEDFEDMMKKRSRFSMVLTCTRPGDTWTGICGRINSEMIQQEIPDVRERLVYICGPPVMVESMVQILHEMTVPDHRILVENFLGY